MTLAERSVRWSMSASKWLRDGHRARASLAPARRRPDGVGLGRVVPVASVLGRVGGPMTSLEMQLGVPFPEPRSALPESPR